METFNDVVEYEVVGTTAFVTMARPQYRNAQNSQMTYALDNAFYRACDDNAVRVIVLRGQGEHFSGGHDIGTPDRDHEVTYPRVATMWWSHIGEEGATSRYAREQEVYLSMCRRWRDIPKPMVASVQGACIAGGLMLAWVCDLIVASDDAFFSDPVLTMGVPGVEYFAHPWVMGSRQAKEFLFLNQTLRAERAYELGMVNEVVPRGQLEERTAAVAEKIALMPKLGLALTKRAINLCEDEMGMRAGMEAVFGLHHLAHAHNAETSGDSVNGHDVKSMKAVREAAEG